MLSYGVLGRPFSGALRVLLSVCDYTSRHLPVLWDGFYHEELACCSFRRDHFVRPGVHLDGLSARPISVAQCTVISRMGTRSAVNHDDAPLAYSNLCKGSERLNAQLAMPATELRNIQGVGRSSGRRRDKFTLRQLVLALRS